MQFREKEDNRNQDLLRQVVETKPYFFKQKLKKISLSQI